MTPTPSVTSLILPLPPSCIAFVPSQPSYFVVGTYLLDAKAEGAVTSQNGEENDSSERAVSGQLRSGSLILYRLDQDEIIHIQTISLNTAVLNIVFRPNASPHKPILYAATSTGTLLSYALVFPDSHTSTFDPVLTQLHAPLEIAVPNALVLDIRLHPRDPDIVGATLSTGRVLLACTTSPAPYDSTTDHVTNTGNEDHASPSKARCKTILTHELEPWTLAFTPDGAGVYSGGDDARLIYSSLPLDLSQRMLSTAGSTADSITETMNEGEEVEEGDDDPFAARHSWTDRRIHAAGVTAILPLPDQQHIIVTGSYDDHIRILSCPPLGRREVLAELDLGGGVWRLCLIESKSGAGDGGSRYVILASCMHAGARIVDIRENGGNWEMEVVGEFVEHKSMNYGSDVQPLSDAGSDDQTRTIVSTSFYDRLLCLWRFRVS